MFSEGRRSVGAYETSSLASEAMMGKAAETIIKYKIEERPSEEDFVEIYQKDEIENDRRMVETMKEKFSESLSHLTESEAKKVKERQKIGEAMEIAINDGGELYEWFGPNANITRTTEYDDIFNGVDAVVEFEDENDETPDRLALVVDVTISNDFKKMEEKIRKNIESLTGKTKNRKHIKYFESPITEEKQSLNHVVPVVLALDAQHSQQLLEKFSQIKKLTSRERKNDYDRNLIRELNKEMAEYPAQMIFLKEIVVQLEHYSTIIKLDTELYDEIQNVLTVIYEVMESKGNIKYEEIEESDRSFKNLKRVLENLK